MSTGAESTALGPILKTSGMGSPSRSPIRTTGVVWSQCAQGFDDLGLAEAEQPRVADDEIGRRSVAAEERVRGETVEQLDAAADFDDFAAVSAKDGGDGRAKLVVVIDDENARRPSLRSTHSRCGARGVDSRGANT